MSKARILVVEDESIVARDIQARLSRLGYSVAGAAVPRRLGFWPKAPQYRSDDDLRRLAAPALPLSIYHASLLPEATITRVLSTLHA